MANVRGAARAAAALLFGALLASCHATPAPSSERTPENVSWPDDVGQLEPRALVPSTATTFPALGYGWDLLQAQPGSTFVPCLSGRLASVEARTTTRRLQRPFTPAELERMVGFGPDDAERFRLISSGGRAAGWAPWIAPGPLSYTRVYGVEERVAIESLDVAGASLLVDPAASDFTIRCGDLLVAGRERGGRVFLLVRIDFTTPAAAEAFATLVGTDVALPVLFERLASSEVQAALRGRAMLGRLELAQFGGDVAQLGSLSDELWGSGCGLGLPSACGALAESFLAYVAGDGPQAFPAQMIGAPPSEAVNLTTLGYELVPWSAVSAAAGRPREAPAVVVSARSALRALVDGRLAVSYRLDALDELEQWAMLPDGDADAIAAGLTQTERDLAVLYGAAHACYDLAGVDDAPAIEACVAGASLEGLAAAGYDGTLTIESLGARVQ